MQLRKTINNFQDAEYNFKLIDRLLKGHLLDGEYIREVPAFKVTGRLEAHQITIGHSSVFEEGYDPDTIINQASANIEDLKNTIGDMAFEDQVELSKLGATIVQGGYLQTILINAASIKAGTIDADRIAAGTITADKIKTRAIETDKIAVGGVTSSNLGAGSVIEVKLGSGAVTGSKIATGAVSAGKIEAGAVTAIKIAAGAVTANKLAANIILSGTIWAGYNRVRLDPSGIDVFGESLDFYYTNKVGSIYASNSTTLTLHADVIALTANNYARAYEFRVSRLRPNPGDTGYVGLSSAKFAYGYFSNLPGCPTPTSNSGINIMKKINRPLVREGRHGRRHYFLDEDFPSEMKCKIMVEDNKGNFVETEEEEIEYIRTIGILVQSMRELIDKVELLEEEVRRFGARN